MGLFVPRSRFDQIHRRKRALISFLPKSPVNLRDFSQIYIIMNKNFIILTIVFLLFSSHTVFGQKRKPKIITKKDLGTVTVRSIPEPEVSTKNLTDEQKLRLETFRAVWTIINEHYFDQTFNGLDWQKLKYENEKKVIALKSDAEFYELLNDLIGQLNASHFSIVPPEYLEEIEKLKKLSEEREIENTSENEIDEDEIKDENEESDNEFLKTLEEFNSRYGIGADVRIFNRDVIITHIDKNSAAEKSGLKIGYSIKSVNGILLADFISQMQQFESYEKKLKNQVTLYIKTILFNGDKDSTLTLDYDDGSGQIKTVSVKREKLEGDLISIMKNMPRQFLQFEKRSLDDETGYIRFNVFTIEAVEKICESISDFKDKKNLIIDLRGNIGGSMGAVFGITGLLIQKGISIGTEINSQNESTHFIEPHLKNFKGKLVIMVDGSSLSAAEIISAALQDNGRGLIIGETSGGEALPSIMTQLPNGALFQYPVANFKSPKGKILEGKGVVPDIAVILDRKLLLEGRDNQLETALFSFKNEAKKETAVANNKELPKGGILSAQPPPPKPKAVKTEAISKLYDPKALEIIDKFVNLIGGAENLRKIESLTSTGTSYISRAGAKIEGTFNGIQHNSGKNIDTYRFDGVGEISEVFDGEKFYVQSQFNGVNAVNSQEKLQELRLEKDFLELVNLKENYKQVKFLGNFERQGILVNLIELRNEKGFGFVLVFDAKSNLLVNRTGTATFVNYDDYRKVNEYLLPFKLSQMDALSVEIDEYKINEKIDETAFNKKNSCFDRID